MKLLKIALIYIGIIAAVFLGASFFYSQKSTQLETLKLQHTVQTLSSRVALLDASQKTEEATLKKIPSKETDRVFFAYASTTDQGADLHLLLFEPFSKKIIAQKNIEIKDFLAPGSFGSAYASEAVQYNEQTGDILFATSGNGGMACQNFDGTCTFRIRKTSFDTDVKSPIVYESEEEPMNWVVHKDEGMIYLRYGYDKPVQIKKLDIASGVIKDVTSTELPDNIYLESGLILTDDHSKIIQVISIRKENKLRVISLDTTSDLVTLQDIDTAGLIVDESNISPDGNYLAVYANIFNKPVMKLFNLQQGTKVDVPLTKGFVTNVNIAWSDGKLYYDVDNSLWSYDLASGFQKKIIDHKLGFPFPVSRSGSYYFYQHPLNTSVHLFDAETMEDITFPLAARIVSEIQAIDWL